MQTKELVKDIKQLAKENRDYVISLRRHFHQYPELSMEEYETSKKVKEELDKMGIEYRSAANTGIIATIKGDKPGKTIALRADMDALPVEELTDFDFKSKIDGRMHACGHDMHTTTLLGAAKLLKSHERELKGTVKLLFQSAEETFQGAKAAVDAGVLENPRVDAAFAMHVAPNSENKKIIYGEYPMTSVYGFRVLLTGKGTHGSAPELGVDPINAGVHLYLALQELIAREISAMEEAVLTIGRFESGSAFNVIPHRAVLEGSLRTFKSEVRDYIICRIKEVAKGVAATYRCEVELEVLNDVPAVKCDVKLNEEIIQSVRELDSELKAYPTFHVMGSEDFSYFGEKIPTSYFFIGAGVDNQDEWVGHHNPHAKFNETCLPTAAAIYAKAAMDWLENHG